MGDAPVRRRLLQAATLAGLAVCALGAALVVTRLVFPAVLRSACPAVVTAAVPREPSGLAWPELYLEAPQAEVLDGGPDGAAGDGGEGPSGRGGGGRDHRTKGAPAARPRATGDLPRVVKLGPGSYAVDRAWVDGARTGEGLGGARAIPYLEDGEVVGFRLTGVSGGPLGTLGLRDGDVLTKVNGQSIASPDGAVEAYRRNAKVSRVVLTVRRGGAPVTLSYRIE